MTRLPIKAARYEIRDKNPYLVLSLEGMPEAWIFWEQKPSINEAGYIFLGNKFQALVPVIPFRVSEDNHLELEGFTDDPRVVKMFADFMAAGSIAGLTGRPLPIPAA